MDASALNPRGQENLLLDIAIMPQTYYQLNAVGQPLAGERLAAWVNLASRSFANNRFRVVTSFRYDLDSGAAIIKTNTGDTLLQPNSYALLAAYFEYDATDDLHFRVGRQFFVDLADYLAFDGARVMWKLPVIPLQLEVYGGIRSNYAMTQGSNVSSLYELDGVAMEDGTQPIFGVALRWMGNQKAREEATLGFRQSWDTGLSAAALAPFNLQTSGTFVNSQELVGSASRDVGPLYLSAGFAYGIALDRLERAKASVVFPVERTVPLRLFGQKAALDLSLDYQRFQPAFSLDSIWNYFTMYPYDEGALGVTLKAGDLRLEAHGFARIFYSQTKDRTGTTIPFSPGTQPAAGGRINGAYSLSRYDVLDAGLSYQSGFGGDDIFFDAGIKSRFKDLPLDAYARITASKWDETLIADNQGSAFGLVGGATWHFPFGASISLILQETVASAATPSSPIFASAVPRVFGVLDLSRWL